MDTKTQPYVIANGVSAPPVAESRTGWVTFAGVVLLVGAVANLFWGLAALDAKPFLYESGLVYSTLETWGWIAIGWSAVLVIGGIALLARATWAPIVGIVVASLSCVFWLFMMPVMSMMSLTVILIDVSVIYGLAVHAKE